MSGIYIHIPFCGSKCGYCDFYSVKLFKDNDNVQDFVETIVTEIEQKSHLFNNHEVNTIYFGGGTPSILPLVFLERIYGAVSDNYSLSHDNVEVTLEINPEHATDDYFSGLRRLGFVNRLSTGFQAMTDSGLRYLGRKHSVSDNYRYLDLCHKYGFDNFSVDYIFGYEILDDLQIENAFRFFIEQRIPHISAYSLGIEDNTPFMLKLRNGKIRKMDDDFYLRQFRLIHEILESNGYNHYEISNYSLPGFHSRHNSNYWHSVPYLGFGPSAHSYYDGRRSWNVRRLPDYRLQIRENRPFAEREVLSFDDLFNEYIMLSLRTREGVDIGYLTLHFANYLEHFMKNLNRRDLTDYFVVNDGHVRLNINGLFISDYIISEFFV